MQRLLSRSETLSRLCRESGEKADERESREQQELRW